MAVIFIIILLILGGWEALRENTPFSFNVPHLVDTTRSLPIPVTPRLVSSHILVQSLTG